MADTTVNDNARVNEELQDIRPENIDTKELTEKVDALEKKIEELKDIKHQIFSVMALFFAVFAFISVTVSLTKGFFSFEGAEPVIYKFGKMSSLKISPIYFSGFFVIITQILFFFFIYKLVVNFLDPNSFIYTKRKKPNKIILFVGISFILLPKMVNLDNKYTMNNDFNIFFTYIGILIVLIQGYKWVEYKNMFQKILISFKEIFNPIFLSLKNCSCKKNKPTHKH